MLAEQYQNFFTQISVLGLPPHPNCICWALTGGHSWVCWGVSLYPWPKWYAMFMFLYTFEYLEQHVSKSMAITIADGKLEHKHNRSNEPHQLQSTTARRWKGREIQKLTQFCELLSEKKLKLCKELFLTNSSLFEPSYKFSICYSLVLGYIATPSAPLIDSCSTLSNFPPNATQ